MQRRETNIAIPININKALVLLAFNLVLFLFVYFVAALYCTMDPCLINWKDVQQQI